MLTKPKLDQQKIAQCLLDVYEITVDQALFLPIGADMHTAVYRVIAIDRTEYFLKVRRGKFCSSSVAVPSYLNHLRLDNILPPITTKTGEYCTTCHGFTLALYQYIDGLQAVETTLSKKQWVEFGQLIKKLHMTEPPKQIKTALPVETFSSKWASKVATFLEQVAKKEYADPISMQAAQFLRTKSARLFYLIQHVKKLRSTLEKSSFDYVMCHGDIHGWNLLIDGDHQLYLIDWDTLILAPKERDLMFIGAGIWDTGLSLTQEKAFFYQGYGEVETQQELLCYYRLERILEDIGVYCEQIFLSDTSKEDRLQSFRYMQTNFLPEGTIDRAFM
ncbi:MAG: aminoglycoside phosphotransferase family protein [Chlamydiota bacterium]